jgi:hypothetical protein
MKKLIFAFLASSIFLSQAFADGGYSCHSGCSEARRPISQSEFLCAVGGGTAAGIIADNAGAGGPVTFLSALIGGFIGVDFCKWFGNKKNVGAQAAAWEADLDNSSCGSRAWEGSEYHGRLRVLAESFAMNNNERQDSTKPCKLIETTIFETGGRHKFIGRTQAWACKQEQGSWIITYENSVNKDGMKTCSNQSLSAGTGNSVSINRGENGYSQGPAPISQKIDTRYIQAMWGPGLFKSRHVNDRGVMRGLKLAARTEYVGELEVGVLKSTSDDGRAVFMYMAPGLHRAVAMDDVGIECRTTGLCSTVEVSSRAGSFNGSQVEPRQGMFQYIFRDGSVGINDRFNGITWVPGNLLN